MDSRCWTAASRLRLLDRGLPVAASAERVLAYRGEVERLCFDASAAQPVVTRAYSTEGASRQ